MSLLGIIASQNYPRITGSYESIATTTVGSGGTSTITFSSIPSGYEHLQLRILGRSTATGTDQISIRFNSDTGSNYSEHFLRGDGSSASAYGGANVSAVQTGVLPGTNQTASVFGGLIVDILDYKNTNKYKTVRMITAFDNNGSGSVGLYSAGWRNTNAITQIEAFVTGYNFVQYSSFALYGIKS
jgi:hypothetical protein